MFKVTARADAAFLALGTRLGDAVLRSGGGRDWLQTQIVSDSGPFVPMNSGELASSVCRSGEGIEYAAPHARRLYYGEDSTFSREKHPQATHHWFEAAKSRRLDAWGRGLARVLGGAWRKS